jgi:DNA-binding MarR family transcriptional regulator
MGAGGQLPPGKRLTPGLLSEAAKRSADFTSRPGELYWQLSKNPDLCKNRLDPSRYMHIQLLWESGSSAIMDNATTNGIDTISRACIARRLRLLNRVITNFYDHALRPLGLKISQLNILVATARLGLARPAQICDILQLDVSTLSRNVKPLQAHGWLEVVPDEDARTQPFRLTAQGRRLIETAVPAWEVAQRQAAELLGNEGVVLLDKAAQKVGISQADR